MSFVTFQQLTGWQEAPTEVATEAWLIIGRRGGKDVKAASLGVYLVTIGAEQYGWRQALKPGERGIVQILAVDRDQVRIRFDLCGSVPGPADVSRHGDAADG